MAKTDGCEAGACGPKRPSDWAPDEEPLREQARIINRVEPYHVAKTDRCEAGALRTEAALRLGAGRIREHAGALSANVTSACTIATALVARDNRHSTVPPTPLSLGVAMIRHCSLLTVAVCLMITSQTAVADVGIAPDVVYGHKSGMALTMDVFTPTEDANGAGVLFMVSGGWYSRWQPPENAQRFFQPLTDRGFTVFAVRHGSSPKFSIPEAVEDVRRAVRFVRMNATRFNVDETRLGVYGASAGGHLSLMLGTASDEGRSQAQDPVLRTGDRVAAVVAYVAPTDLRIMVWEAPDHLPAYKRFPALDLDLKAATEMSPILHVTADDPPTLLVAGDQDELVPIAHSHNIHKTMQDKGVVSRLVVLEGAGHGFGGKDAERATSELVAWFEKHLN